MKTPQFDDQGNDDETFAPFRLEDGRVGGNNDFRLAFYDFNILEDGVGIDPDDYSIDGNAMGEILTDIIDSNDLVQHKSGEHDGGYFDNCEMDTCYFHFNSLEDATRVAEYCNELFSDKVRLTELMTSHGYLGDEEEE